MTACESLLTDILACRLCQAELPHAPNPVLQIDRRAKLMIVGQAPGVVVHQSGVPFADASGDRLRQWLGLERSVFYSADVAIVPMGFCFPGRGKNGDLPPRAECAVTWHARILAALPNVRTTVLLGRFAQHRYLGTRATSLTNVVRNYAAYFPDYIPLPHPSPRNNIWLKRNPWFEQEVVPALQSHIRQLI